MSTPTKPDIPALVAQVHDLGEEISAGDSSNAIRKQQLRLAALKLHRALEDPGNIVERICFQTATIRVGIDLDLFNVLFKSEKPLTCGELAKTTGADSVLLGRLLRSLEATGAFGVIGDPGKEAYVPTTTTETFTAPPLAAGVEFCFDFLSMNWHELPAYLKRLKYQNPSDGQNTAFNAAYNTKDIAMQFTQTQPAVQRAFQLYMSDFYQGRASWMDFYPVEERLGKDAKQSQEAVMIVDVGGGFGHEAAALKKQHPELPGRFVVQDLPSVTSDIKHDYIEAMTHDFFTPQPLRGARVCYLRMILHDWNDEQCHTILSHLRDAMNPAYSKILINQWVLPTQQLTPFMAHMDFNMMATFSAMERTEEQTRNLLDRAGLKVSQIYYPVDEASECIVEVVTK
ncbi:MAG: hypothetical protein OHK93_004928 [Ramalina farinacea]|uniref:O-methyltransferase domain-containing protein n=1 Tax=Ramalina farinacea TaxID=258253 RepID=A0AA43TVI8_9LECA|nr:hypothetical protein [Ramalina farinacea]